MWAYLFWTVVAAWLFSIRAKRDVVNDLSGACARAHHQQARCPAPICEYQRSRPSTQREAAVHRLVTGRNSGLQYGGRSERDTSKSDWSKTRYDSDSSESDDNRTPHRERPPHLDRPFGSVNSPRQFANNERSKQCRLCPRVLPSFKSLKQHLSEVHPRQNSSQNETRSVSAYSNKLPFVCDSCGLRADSHFNLQHHVAAKHQETLDRQATAHLLECYDCGRFMDNKNNLMQHKARKHGTPTSVHGPPVGAEVCDVCETTFDDEFQLHQHKGVHHMWSLFCKQCSIQFDDTSEAIAHYSKEHGARNVHPQRIQAFLDSLVVQEDEEEDLQKVFSCEKCGLDYSTRKELRQHYDDPFAHGTWGDQSPHFPPLILAAPPSPPPLPAPVPMSSIDTDASLPSFELSAADVQSARLSQRGESIDPVNPSFGSSGMDRAASPAPSTRQDFGAIGQPVTLNKPPSPPVLNPVPRPQRSRQTLNKPTFHGTYVPEMVGDFETSVPSFRMVSSESEGDAFPSIVPGPLPAPTRAPLSAWSKPLGRKSSSPIDRPLDHPKVPRYTPGIKSSNNDQSFSSSIHDRQRPNRNAGYGPRYGRDSATPELASESPLSGSNTVSPVPRKAWGERGSPRVRTPSATSHSGDTAPSPVHHPGKKAIRSRRSETSGSESPKRRLEPIFDSTGWEVLGAPPQKTVAPVYQSAPVRCAQEDSRMRWAREAEERKQITEACVAAGGEDPFGGW